MIRSLFKSKLLLIVFSFAFNYGHSQNAQFLLGSEGLPSGKYHAGFKRIYTFDSSRSYPLNFQPGTNSDTTKFPRSMVLNMWYPVEVNSGGSFPYKNYLRFAYDNPSWKNFLDRLKQYNEETVKLNGFRYTKLNDTVREDRLFERLMDTEVLASSGKPVVTGNHPLIIYQPSLGGTIEENALLCQYLSSNGYVVLSCAYQPDNGVRMGPDWNLERAEGDVNFLVQYSKQHLVIDTNNVHLLGYSFGAQANFNLLAKGSKFVSAVSLDSRLEYSFDYAPKGFKDLPALLLAGVQNITQPLLLFTNEEATFNMTDSFVSADRYYLPLHFLEHHDYSSTREISNSWVAGELKNDKELLGKVKDYTSVCENTLAFFNFYSQPKNNGRAFQFLNTRSNFAEHLPRGANGEAQDKTVLQTPRQVLKAAEIIGIQEVKKSYQLNRMSFSEDLFNTYAYFLAGKNKGQLAIQTLLWGTEIYTTSANLFDSLGEMYFIEKDYEKSTKSFKRSLELNPSNKNAVEYLKKLQSLAGG
ncbi:tetratricopeptide repeat protein [Pedobacter steynii]|uniref:Uncharacterized protein n=1 Tax=Pedobacter steynii TaxID=430522 RepID=A0A1D7QN12_9SPHI|nr:tetratricopeptide repeat protein [Pedobacter steynii]AOM80043.1 hypothetical protein BFS30_24495 [Pedobacter steynii]